MLKDDFEGFILNREEAILSEIRHVTGIQEAAEKPTLISPGKPFTNTVIMRDTIRNCEEYIHWIDKYFSNEGLELLSESVNKGKVSSIKILSAIPNTNLRLKKSFERFKEEMKNYNITCDFRILIDYDDASKLHDRWILSRNVNYNIPSPDVVARGQYSEVNKTDSTLPFEDLWKKGLDIISRWNEIDKAVQEYNDRKRR